MASKLYFGNRDEQSVLERDRPNGYAGLGDDGKILTSAVPTATTDAIEAAQSDAASALARVATNVTCASDADAAAVRTALVALLAALKAGPAPLMTPDA